MQAIILAAGMGRRLGSLTAENTKCMVKVNGTCLIDRMLRQLKALKLDRVVVVTGYESQRLRQHIEAIPTDYRPKTVFIDNPDYATTNNIHSLWIAREYLADDDTLLLESDIILDDGILQALVESEWNDVALVDKYQPWMDGTMVQIDPTEGHIVSFVPKKAFRYADIDSYYKTVNVYKLSQSFSKGQYLPFLEAYIRAMGQNEYYEQVLRVLTTIDSTSLKALPLTRGSRWYEIDDIQDLHIAEVLFSDPESRLQKLHSSYGGFWRYPGLLDFCYLVNPYYPSERMVDEMASSFPTLLRNYPSGMSINTLLAAKFFGIDRKYVSIGNGAAELISALMDSVSADGRIGLILPSFEEYYNRLPADSIETMMAAVPEFRYTAQDIIDRFSGTDISTLLIVNPDNPSGNFIDRTGIDMLIQWSADNHVRLIIDESFVDFAHDRTAATLLNDALLEANPHLVVVKSISKSYGVPGLRLGIVATADSRLTSDLRHRCSIWNINSFAEYYLQIAGKYERDYRIAADKISAERDRMYQLLSDLTPAITVLPSEANYFLCRLADGLSAHAIAVELLDRYQILIKDCSAKRGFPQGSQYIRLAVRDTRDNDLLIKALTEILRQ